MLLGCYHQTQDTQIANQSPGPLSRFSSAAQVTSHSPSPLASSARVRLRGLESQLCSSGCPPPAANPENLGLGDVGHRQEGLNRAPALISRGSSPLTPHPPSQSSLRRGNSKQERLWVGWEGLGSIGTNRDTLPQHQRGPQPKPFPLQSNQTL